MHNVPAALQNACDDFLQATTPSACSPIAQVGLMEKSIF